MVREVKERYCLKYLDGRYLSWDKDHFPLTHNISEARRFNNAVQIAEFLIHSNYRPELFDMDPGDFEIQPMEIEYRERETDE